jgi:nucleoside 2-deoxyribosyltransferase
VKTSIQQMLNQLGTASIRNPKVYLAGKIRPNCWRDTLIEDLYKHHWQDGTLRYHGFDYVGPFYVDCSHGCYKHPNTHGTGPGCSTGLDINKRKVSKACLMAIDSADLVFCYIDANDCHGTLFEIGYAVATGIKVVICFAPTIATPTNNDFWFACEKAHEVFYNIEASQLEWLLQEQLRDLI